MGALPALEDYQRHRRGIADAAQRLGMAMQEAGQRSMGPFGDALGVLGMAHRQAAAQRLDAHTVEERQAFEPIRMHYEQAAKDCKRALREYEAARKELRLLRQA